MAILEGGKKNRAAERNWGSENGRRLVRRQDD
jgi:hypothetical protein